VTIDGSDNSAPQQGSAKMTWIIILFALVMAVLSYGVLCFFMSQNRTSPTGNSLATMRPLMYALAVVSLVASIGWLQWKTSGRIGEMPGVVGSSYAAVLMEPNEFQTQSIVALALAESCSVYGLVLFFLGAPITEFGVFAAGSLLVILLYILPRGLKYWAALENGQKQSGQNSPFSS
jgi:F0F1-type ATP synthase membrane subunit c/vacuolar-type H+-ATPase subunit K